MNSQRQEIEDITTGDLLRWETSYLMKHTGSYMQIGSILMIAAMHQVADGINSTLHKKTYDDVPENIKPMYNLYQLGYEVASNKMKRENNNKKAA